MCHVHERPCMDARCRALGGSPLIVVALLGCKFGRNASFCNPQFSFLFVDRSPATLKQKLRLRTRAPSCLPPIRDPLDIPLAHRAATLSRFPPWVNRSSLIGARPPPLLWLPVGPAAETGQTECRT